VPNTNPNDWIAGDLVFAHSTGIIGKAIRFAERIRGKGGDNWNHVAVLSRRAADGTWYIFQAEAAGVTDDKTLDSVAPGGHYEVVPLPLEVDRFSFYLFIHSQVGAKYGFLSILSCAVDIIIPDSICLRQAKTWICSGLVAAGLLAGDYRPAQDWAMKDLYTTMPSEICTEIGEVKCP
jgi:hypothetical protein